MIGGVGGGGGWLQTRKNRIRLPNRSAIPSFIRCIIIIRELFSLARRGLIVFKRILDARSVIILVLVISRDSIHTSQVGL